MSDLTRTGDSFQTNHMVDNVLVAADGRCDAMARLYANGHDLKDPMLSPVYGDMTGFPPTLLTTGTRDLLLSNTVRVHASCARPASRRNCTSTKDSRTRTTCATSRRRRRKRRSRRSQGSSENTGK